MSQVYVWDKFIRIFHWSLVALFLISYLTGDEFQSIHTWSGYSITVLVFARLAWGFAGSKYARFSEFVQTPKKVMAYLKQIASGKPKRYIGHNPAGGAMVVAILVALIGTTFSGMKLLAIEEGEGPFAQSTTISLVQPAFADEDRYEDHDEHEDSAAEKSGHEPNEADEEFWEEIHEFFINMMLLLIVLHLIGVVVASRQHGESLVKAMMTGKKGDS